MQRTLATHTGLSERCQQKRVMQKDVGYYQTKLRAIQRLQGSTFR